ncbi:hypothetical protein, partial [Bacillus cereus]
GMSSLIGMIRKGKGCVHEMHVEFRIVGETEEERIARLDEVGGKKKKEKKKPITKNKSTGAKRPTEVTLADGTKRIYESANDCAASLGIPLGSICYSITRGNGYMPSRQLSFRYLDEK